VAIAPVNYAVAESAVWFRTLPYSNLGRECAGQRLAVEVDHIEPRTHSGWSVIVAGTADLVRPDEVPEVLADMQVWPAGTRSQFVRVDPAEVTGRRLLQAPLDDRDSVCERPSSFREPRAAGVSGRS
jgi:hypothetical protein